jgi:hypothetical protein
LGKHSDFAQPLVSIGQAPCSFGVRYLEAGLVQVLLSLC